jgi:Protein of unknown function (DUF3223)
MAKPVQLSNGRTWPTQGAALAHFKEMLARYGDEEIVEDHGDHEDLLAVLERYDAVIVDGPAKIGAGVDLFFRRQNRGDGYSTPGFWVRRVDGSETDFSYIAAVKGTPKSSGQEFYDACRAAVAADLKAAKRRHFAKHGDEAGRVPCELTDALVTIEEAHLDHAYPTFGQLVLSFRAARGWQHEVPAGTVSLPADRQITSTFADPALTEAFRAFHNAAAMLRIVSATRNLAMSAGQRRPKIRLPVELI